MYTQIFTASSAILKTTSLNQSTSKISKYLFNNTHQTVYHPRLRKSKIYHVTRSKPMKRQHCYKGYYNNKCHLQPIE